MVEFGFCYVFFFSVQKNNCFQIGFRSRFGRVQELKDQKAQVGGVAVIKHESRYIYYLVTKDNAYKKPTYDDLKSSLQAMKKHMVRPVYHRRFYV